MYLSNKGRQPNGWKVIIMIYRVIMNDGWVKKFTDIVPGITYCNGRDPKVIGEYNNLEDALKAFDKFESSLITEENNMFNITEVILEQEYEDGYSDLIKVTEPYIELINEHYDVIAVFRNCKAAKDAEDKAVEQGLNVYLSYR